MVHVSDRSHVRRARRGAWVWATRVCRHVPGGLSGCGLVPRGLETGGERHVPGGGEISDMRHPAARGGAATGKWA